MFAYFAAAGVALGGMALGQVLVDLYQGRLGYGWLAILVFGWPVALGAALLMVPAHAVLARCGRVSEATTVLAGSAVGLAVGMLWHTQPFYLQWAPLVGSAAGYTWWRVWTSENEAMFGAGSRVV